MSKPALVSENRWLKDAEQCLRDEKPIRMELPGGGRLHIDRPLPFLFVHLAKPEADQIVARAVAQANASYAVMTDEVQLVDLVRIVSRSVAPRFGSLFVVRCGELQRDLLLTDDTPFLPPFEILLWASVGAGNGAKRFAEAVTGLKAKFRLPKLENLKTAPCALDENIARLPDCEILSVEFAPVYRAPQSQTIFPELRERLVATLFDAGLQACAAMFKAGTLASHRSLGRRAFVDAVSRVDRGIDKVASSFDVLLAVTPINADEAYRRFVTNGFNEAPEFLYRPLAVQVEAAKRELYSITFDQMEDPVLYELYREKQREVDLQLSLIASRERRTFVEFSRAIYGAVETSLLSEARSILAELGSEGSVGIGDPQSDAPIADAAFVEKRAKAMIAVYRHLASDFEMEVERRDDLPSGLMVTRDRLLISTATAMDRRRVEPLLSHEIGVHLLTYFNGSSQGLRLFRSGLSGYEGMQEGLAVFAEYLSGGMTAERLRLIAARVVACHAMLSGATFSETFHTLVAEHGFTHNAAFSVALRVYRGGGFAKDAIYLRGLLELLDHLKHGGALEPFWMGKIASAHFAVMEELASRGLLKRPAIEPLFLGTAEGRERLTKARQGMRPLELVQSKEA